MATQRLSRKKRFRLAVMAADSSITEWARENDVSRTHLYAVLDGVREPSQGLRNKIEAVLRKQSAA